MIRRPGLQTGNFGPHRSGPTSPDEGVCGHIQFRLEVPQLQPSTLSFSQKERVLVLHTEHYLWIDLLGFIHKCVCLLSCLELRVWFGHNMENFLVFRLPKPCFPILRRRQVVRHRTAKVGAPTPSVNPSI